jgi:4-amino-4-deoxy-L-arabinose transferase-like glycosyltransferase
VERLQTEHAVGEERADASGLVLGVALVMGLTLRLAPILITDFPLRDGGLFVTMARDLQASGFVPPMYSTFNAGNVPFAYPPLGILLQAAIPGDPIDTERWLPLAWSMVAVVAAWLLARELSDDLTGAVAALLFAVAPITWAIEGGGISRAPGLALLLLALYRLALLLRSRSIFNALLAGALAGLALLSHPQVGPTGLASALLLFVFRPSWRGGLLSVLAGAVALAAVSPWLISVLFRYGLEPLLAAAGAHDTGPALARLLVFGPTWLAPFDLVTPFAVVGAAVAIHRRKLFPIAWLVALLVVPGGEGRYAAVAWALLAAIGILPTIEVLRVGGAARLAIGLGLCFLFLAALVAGYRRFGAIPAGTRQAVIAAGQQSLPGTRFAVIASDPTDSQPLLDWFPTLSGRISVGTSQGLEFTTPAKWQAASAADDRIQGGQFPDDVDQVFEATPDGGRTYPRP